MPASNRPNKSRAPGARPQFIEAGHEAPAGPGDPSGRRALLSILGVLATAAVLVAVVLALTGRSTPPILANTADANSLLSTALSGKTPTLPTLTPTSHPTIAASPTTAPTVPPTALPLTPSATATIVKATTTIAPSLKPTATTTSTATVTQTSAPTEVVTPSPVPTGDSKHTPPLKLIPDSELVNSPGVRGFDPVTFIQTHPGVLRHYTETVTGRRMTGTESLIFIATNTSVNPRLLLALLEYQSHWLTQNNLPSKEMAFPMGYLGQQQQGLFNQLMWAANTLNEGYYGAKTRGTTVVRFADASHLIYAPSLNPGTMAVQYFFAQVEKSRTRWARDVGLTGFMATYQALFGDPFQKAVEPLIPPDLRQPEFVLPFPQGQTWYFSAGPHGGWDRTQSGWAAIDFAPPKPPDDLVAAQGKCYTSPEWATAVIGGRIARSEDGAVVIDVDGDGDERTGWTVLYLHIADEERAPVGTVVQTGEHIGHPSCEGFFLLSPGTHLHIARRYNGEWIPADCKVCALPMPPFVLGAWTVKGSPVASLGWLTNGTQIKRIISNRDDSINGVSW